MRFQTRFRGVDRRLIQDQHRSAGINAFNSDSHRLSCAIMDEQLIKSAIEIGFPKLIEMLQTRFGVGFARWRAKSDREAKISAAKTDKDLKLLGIDAEYAEKKARLMAERDLKQFEAQLRAEDLPAYIEPEVLIEWPEPELIVSETPYRPFQHVEQRRLTNIKQVTIQAADALKALPAAESISEQPVDPDWTARFFDSVQDVSNDEMQRLWGQLLAGEIASPGRFSLRTLDVLRNLSSKEAQLFHRYMAFCTDHAQIFIPGDVGQAFQLNRKELTSLIEMGLLHVRYEGLFGADSFNVHLPFRQRIIMIEYRKVKKLPGSLVLWPVDTYRLTQIGIELANMRLPAANEAFVEAVSESAKKQGYRVTAVNFGVPSE